MGTKYTLHTYVFLFFQEIMLTSTRLLCIIISLAYHNYINPRHKKVTSLSLRE